jgi:hypothetical protein
MKRGGEWGNVHGDRRAQPEVNNGGGDECGLGQGHEQLLSSSNAFLFSPTLGARGSGLAACTSELRPGTADALG